VRLPAFPEVLELRRKDRLRGCHNSERRHLFLDQVEVSGVQLQGPEKGLGRSLGSEFIFPIGSALVPVNVPAVTCSAPLSNFCCVFHRGLLLFLPIKNSPLTGDRNTLILICDTFSEKFSSSIPTIRKLNSFQFLSTPSITNVLV